MSKKTGILFFIIVSFTNILCAQWELVPDTSTPAALEEIFKKYESMPQLRIESKSSGTIANFDMRAPLSISPDIPIPQTELEWDADTILLEKFNGSTSGEVFGGINYVDSIPNLNKAIYLSQGSWIRYIPSGLPQLEAAGSIEFFIYPTSYNIGLLSLQWLLTNIPPRWGYVLHFSLLADGKIRYAVWNWGGDFGLAGNTQIPLNAWTHVGIMWDNSGSKIYINGKLDASTPRKIWPASPSYVYLGYWGINNDTFIDEFRISKVARIRELKPKKIITLNKWSGDKQIGVVNKPLTNPLIVRTSDQITNTPVSDIEINFQIQAPSGSTGQVVNPAKTSTDINGFGQTTATLGNKQGDYTITANSPVTIPPSVEFKACGRLDVPHYSQLDSRWGDIIYDEAWDIWPWNKIKNQGCALTAATMVSNYYTKPHDFQTDPGKLNSDLIASKGYTSSLFHPSGGKIKWDVVACLSKSMFFDYASSGDKGRDLTEQGIRNLIETKLKGNNPVIAEMKGVIAEHHYTVITAKCEDGWIAQDPYFGAERKIPFDKEILGIRSFVASPTYPAPCTRSLLSWLSSPAELLMTDPSGNKTGFEPATKLVIRNILNSGYFMDAIDNPETGETDPNPTKQLGIPNPAIGTYKLDVIGIATGTYTLGIDGITENGTVKETMFKGVTAAGIINTFELNYTGLLEQPVIPIRTATFESTRKDIELSLTFGLITNEGIANSLTQKLNNAEEAKNKGNIKPAQNILEALINEIDAQTDKHINKDAAEFLKQDIQYLINHL
ncbi:MAG: C39 family peptidase [Elusimicrobia bacterium]|nr:C39 family peptidase [Elusimicrobiota bacterium]